MKGGTSRTSRISADGRESFDNSIPGIPDSKWHELLEREENDVFLLGLREEILQKSMETIFEDYLERQAVAFTVHCAYLAWVKVLDVCYMFKDPGDYEDPKVVESWQPDEEPTPSKVDSWASECIGVKEPTNTHPRRPRRAKASSTKKSSLDSRTESLESMSFLADLFQEAEEEYLPMLGILTPSTSTRSIFTRTLSMPRALLPMNEPLKIFTSCNAWGNTGTKEEAHTRKTS